MWRNDDLTATAMSILLVVLGVLLLYGFLV